MYTITPQQKKRHLKVIELYKIHKKKIIVAKILGISRERVRQILMKYHIPTYSFRKVIESNLQSIKDDLKNGIPAKEISKRLGIKYDTMLYELYTYTDIIIKNTYIRKTELCKECNKNKVSGKGLCKTCYDRKYHKHYVETHREKINEINRRWRKNNPDYFKNYYHKNRPERKRNE